MLGIIIKDYYESFCIKKNTLSMLFSLIIIIFLILWMKDLYSYVLLVGVMLPLIGASTLQYSMEQDEISKYDQILLTFPVTRKEIVQSKLIAATLFTLFSNLILNFIIFMIFVFIYQSVDVRTALFVWCAGFILSFIYNAILSTGLFALGNKKGTILFVITVVCLAVGYLLFEFNVGVESIINFDKNYLLAIGAVLAIILNILSYYACIKIYSKKHS